MKMYNYINDASVSSLNSACKFTAPSLYSDNILKRYINHSFQNGGNKTTFTNILLTWINWFFSLINDYKDNEKSNTAFNKARP